MEFAPFIELFILLVICHFIADYPMQSDFIATAKNHTTELGKMFWKWVLPSHGAVHALPVLIITQSFVLAMFEWVAHCFIDYLKCSNKITLNQDQWLHIGCKLFYVVLLAAGVPYLV